MEKILNKTVKIIWKDASTQEGWVVQSNKGIKLRLALIESIGYLLNGFEEEDFIAICQSIAYNDGDFLNALMIPKGSIEAFYVYTNTGWRKTKIK